MKLRDNIISFARFTSITVFFISTIALSYWLSFIIRFESNIPVHQWKIFLQTLPILIIIRLFSAYYFGLFKGWMGYASVLDFVDIFKHDTVSSLAFGMFLVLSWQVFGFSRSVVLIDWLLNLLFVSGARFFRRFIKEIGTHFRHTKNIDDKKHILIIGAGDAGVALLREMRNNTRLNYHPIGFIDDNDRKIGKKISGIPVLGNHRDIPDIVSIKKVDEVIIAIPSASASRIKSIINSCKKSEIKIKTTPCASNLVDGGVRLYQVRDIAVEDILGRETVSLDREAIKSEIGSKKILITGAGGSIGSELSLQISQYGVKELILYERGETELYEIEMKIRNSDSKSTIVPIIGDVLEESQLNEVMEKYKPDLVYHAAAYKHVPMMELNVIEAVKNNLLGSIIAAKTAKKHGVGKFIFVSTDKAVRPTSVMGATKRATELVLKSMENSSTKFITVRFGNVLDSRGSVVPLFKKQIAQGGPVTVTHPFIIRFFMSIPEASQLILQASVIGTGGELFLLDMGEPVRIVDLAENVIRLSGLEPYKDIEIKFTGLRAGEKLYEELFNPWEELLPTTNKKIMKVNSVQLDYNFVKSAIMDLEGYIKERDRKNVIASLKSIVPSFKENFQFSLDDSVEKTIDSGLELDIRYCGREFRGKVVGVERKKTIQISLYSIENNNTSELSGKIQGIFYCSHKKKVVRFYASIIQANQPPIITVEYPKYLEEREDLRNKSMHATAVSD